jgi:hypothetical protein
MACRDKCVANWGRPLGGQARLTTEDACVMQVHLVNPLLMGVQHGASGAQHVGILTQIARPIVFTGCWCTRGRQLNLSCGLKLPSIARSTPQSRCVRANRQLHGQPIDSVIQGLPAPLFSLFPQFEMGGAARNQNTEKTTECHRQGIHSRSCSTRLAVSWQGLSPISSRNNVPPSASRPANCLRAVRR